MCVNLCWLCLNELNAGFMSEYNAVLMTNNSLEVNK